MFEQTEAFQNKISEKLPQKLTRRRILLAGAGVAALGTTFDATALHGSLVDVTSGMLD